MTRGPLGIPTLASALVLGLLAAPAAQAQDAPEKPRIVTFKDGRTYIGEIVTTEAGGMRMRIPQGETLVGFYAFRGIKASNTSAWRSQRDWEVVVVGPDAARVWVEQNVRTLAGVKVSGDDGLTRSLALGPRQQVKACAPADLDCMEEASSRSSGWNWIVSVDPDASGDGAVLRGALSTREPTARRRVQIADFSDPEAVLTGLDELLGLENVPGRAAAVDRLEDLAPKLAKAPDKAKAPKQKKDKAPKQKKEKVAKAPKQKSPRDKSSIGLDVLVPLPGYPSLKRGDTGSFGMAVGVAVPATAVWVVATGGESTSLPEHAILSVGGYYVTTVFLNHLMGQRTVSRMPAVSLGPTLDDDGRRGAMLRVDGRF